MRTSGAGELMKNALVVIIGLLVGALFLLNGTLLYRTGRPFSLVLKRAGSSLDRARPDDLRAKSRVSSVVFMTVGFFIIGFVLWAATRLN